MSKRKPSNSTSVASLTEIPANHKDMTKKNIDSTITLNNASGWLLAILLNQEGWTKGVVDALAAGDLLHGGILPSERPSGASEAWDSTLVEVTITETQLKSAKKCVSTNAEKGIIIPGKHALHLLEALGFEIPNTEPTLSIELPNAALKHLLDVLSTGGITSLPDLVSSSQLAVLLPALPRELTNPNAKAALEAWAKALTTITITERQKDAAKAALRKSAEKGGVRADEYTSELYTAFGLRE